MLKNKKILVTGAAGYIGGTFTYEILKRGFEVFGIDNFINSDRKNIDIFLNKYPEKFQFSEINLADDVLNIKKILNKFNPDFIVHFAGLKSVAESNEMPEKYLANNVGSTKNLLENMKSDVFFIFSSSATVYGDNSEQPLNESSPIKTTSVYGSTKIKCENLIKHYSVTKGIKSICLRYFNPVGSHEDNIVVEDSYNNPNNLMPKLIQVAMNNTNLIDVYGSDYNTRDGTGERDYIHIIDLIEGHISAMYKVQDIDNIDFFNLGTGVPTSVLEMVKKFNETNGLKVKVNYEERRNGDVAVCYADPNKALKELNWKANLGLERMCKDAWEAIQNDCK